MVRPAQSKIARDLLGWTQDTLAKIVGISTASIGHFERGQAEFRPDTIRTLNKAFDNAHVDFPNEYLVRRHMGAVEVLKGSDALKELWQDIFQTLQHSGGEILIADVDEGRTLSVEQKYLTAHIDRLKENRIAERLLSREGDTHFIMPRECYRWVPEASFSEMTSTYIYQGKVAHQIWREDMIVVIKSDLAYEAEKRRFEYAWEHAKVPV